jgi:hypothetical protein
MSQELINTHAEPRAGGAVFYAVFKAVDKRQKMMWHCKYSP